MRNRFLVTVITIGVFLGAPATRTTPELTGNGWVQEVPVTLADLVPYEPDAVLAGYEASWKMWVETMHDPGGHHQDYVFRHLTGSNGEGHLFILGFLASQHQRFDGSYTPNPRVSRIGWTRAEVLDCGTETLTHLDTRTGEVLETVNDATVSYRATMVRSNGNWRRSALTIDPEGCAPR